MKGKELARCYQCYYAMWIHPTQDGYASVSTCCNNMFRKENRIRVKEGLEESWNSAQFQFQRKLRSKKNWSSCTGASCEYRPFSSQLIDEEVENAISQGKTELEYLPKMITIIPSETCNNKCSFCYQDLRRRGGNGYRLRNNLIQELKTRLIPKCSWIVVSGGEPLFSSEGLDIINWVINNYPQKKLCILTNGTLLHQFGFDKIRDNNIWLRISMYGMRSTTYKAVTKVDNFNTVLQNVENLIKLKYEKMKLAFIVSKESIVDVEEFCKFIERNPLLHGIVENNYFGGKKYYGLLERLERKYAQIASRLIFGYRNEGVYKRIIRRLYTPWYCLRYKLRTII